TADTQAPTAPTNLTATGGIGSVSLSWTASTDNVGVANYNVHRSTTPNFTPTTANRIAQPTSNSYTDAGMAAGTYSYRVTAPDAAAPYSVAWDTTAATNGTHTLTARARDAAGNQTTSSAVTVTVSNTAPTGLVAAWGFNEGTGTTTADASGNSNTGTVTNTTWAATGKYGKALSFNGTNSWVTVNDSASLDLTTGMTLEAWVNPTAINGWECVVLKEDTTDLAYALYGDNNGNDSGGPRRPVVSVRQGGATSWTPGSAQVPLNTWSHMAATYDGTALRMYVNGTLASTLSLSGPS